MEKELIKAKLHSTKLFLIVSLFVAVILFIFSLQSVNRYDEGLLLLCFWLSIFLVIDALFVYFYFGRCSLVITNQRVYGKAAFGRQVDLPLDSISAIGTGSIFKSVIVSTSSGAIKFYLVKNSEEVYEVVSRLLRERQNTSSKKNTETIIHDSNADELKKYKDLLDEGIITQEEFDAKKKQLLGL